MSQNERQQRFVERILEDERLRGGLEDAAATALVNWASARVEAAAANPALPDDAVEAEVQAVRSAARSAARSGESDPQHLIALAEAALTKGADAAAAPPPGTLAATAPAAAQEPAPAHAASATTTAAPAAQEPAAITAPASTQAAPAPTTPPSTSISTAPSTPHTPAKTPGGAHEPSRARPSARRWQRFIGWLKGKRQERR